MPVALIPAAIGALFFLSIAGWQMVWPTNYEWAMKLDWRIHFLGWHIFRGEPWAWPPGMLRGYYHAPDGTAIGYTDSLPLVAIPLKLVSALLPMPFQYLGMWLVACFALQGWFGFRLARLWTSSRAAAVAAAMMFVLLPTLLNRVVHPALCAHWVLLWALELYFRWSPGRPLPVRSSILLALVVGLIHPYLAVMVLAILSALAARIAFDRSAGEASAGPRWAPAAATWLASVGAVLAGWWMSGLLQMPGDALARPGLGLFSMNLLAPITSSGWSAFLPAIPVATGGQPFEGFQYFGAGALGVIGVALVVARKAWRAAFTWRLAPLLIVCATLAGFALSPRVTLGDTVLLDLSGPIVERLAVFGVTGRFFWPLAYAVLALATSAVLTRVPGRPATAIFLIAAVIQLLDLRPGYRERYAYAHDETFHHWPQKPVSPVWAEALPHYDRFVLFNPLQCGPAPVTFEVPAFLGGLYGLTVNVGEVARSSEAARARYCAELERELSAGEVDDRTVYLVHPANEARLRAHAPTLRCGIVDGIRLCVTARSYEPWRSAAPLE